MHVPAAESATPDRAPRGVVEPGSDTTCPRRIRPRPSNQPLPVAVMSTTRGSPLPTGSISTWTASHDAPRSGSRWCGMRGGRTDQMRARRQATGMVMGVRIDGAVGHDSSPFGGGRRVCHRAASGVRWASRTRGPRGATAGRGLRGQYDKRVRRNVHFRCPQRMRPGGGIRGIEQQVPFQIRCGRRKAQRVRRRVEHHQQHFGFAVQAGSGAAQG